MIPALSAILSLLLAIQTSCDEAVLSIVIEAGTSEAVLWAPEGPPTLGGPFSLQLRGGAPGARAFLAWSDEEPAGAPARGLGGLLLDTPYPLATVVLDHEGNSPAVPIPPAVLEGLCGITVLVQGLVDDPASGQLRLTNGLELRPGIAAEPFFAGTHVAAGDGPRDLALGDLDSDGRVDAVVLNWTSDDVSVFSGDGAGTLTALGAFATADAADGILLGDLDGDSALDVVVASSQVWVHPGLGGGTFGAASTYAAGASPTQVVGGDLNGDGWTDLVMPTLSADVVAVLLGEPGGSFQPFTHYPTGERPRSASLADLDLDGALDVAVANDGFGSTPGSVVVLLGDGAGGLGSPLTLADGPDRAFVVATELNQDGFVDLAVVNDDTSGLSVFLGQGGASFAPSTTYSVAAFPVQVVATEIDGDGKRDLVISSSLTDSIQVLRNTGDGLLAPLSTYPAGQNPGGLATADLSADGSPDVVAANSSSDDITVFTNIVGD
ncbi:MAG: VCBS repeat-containing protein [Planctomycetota bacterium]